MAKQDDLEQAFNKSIASQAPGGSGQGDISPATAAIGFLGKAILRLDETSRRLSWVNIWLGTAILVAAIVQICLMLRGR